MYRIELSLGEETAFRSIEELAVAIRRNVVTARARIWHSASSKWLPIQLHPHYKIALEMPLTQADLVAGPPVAQRSALNLTQSEPTAGATPLSARQSATEAALAAWPEPKPSSAPPAAKPNAPAPPKESPFHQAPKAPPVAPRRVVEPRRAEGLQFIDPMETAQPTRVVEPAKAKFEPAQAKGRFEPARPKSVPVKAKVEPVRAQGRRRKPKRPLRVALAGAVVIACAHLLVSAATSRTTSDTSARPRTPRQLIEAPAQALKDATPRTVAAVLPMLQSIPVPGFTTSSSQAAVAKVLGSKRAAAVQKPEPIASQPAIVDSLPEDEIQAAPDSAEISGSVPAATGTLTPQIVDSSGKKAIKGILRTISAPPSQVRTPKR